MSARCSADGYRELVERLRNQCVVARWLGEQAVGVIRRELAEAWEAGRTTSRSPAPDPESAPAAAPGGDAVVPVAPADPVVVEPAVAAAAPAAVRAASRSATVPFEGYDTLPANHIVQRLRRMTPDELRNAGSYEELHRNRSTVLGMVEQLLDG